eukprot:314871-Rhodomonas_salina.1
MGGGRRKGEGGGREEGGGRREEEGGKRCEEGGRQSGREHASEAERMWRGRRRMWAGRREAADAERATCFQVQSAGGRGRDQEHEVHAQDVQGRAAAEPVLLRGVDVQAGARAAGGDEAVAGCDERGSAERVGRPALRSLGEDGILWRMGSAGGYFVFGREDQRERDRGGFG